MIGLVGDLRARAAVLSGDWPMADHDVIRSDQVALLAEVDRICLKSGRRVRGAEVLLSDWRYGRKIGSLPGELLRHRWILICGDCLPSAGVSAAGALRGRSLNHLKADRADPAG